MKTFYTHKQVMLLQIATALLAVLLMVATGLAQVPSIQYLPIVYGAPNTAPASTCNGTPIGTTDTGDLDAIRLSDGSFIVAYQNRQDNSRIHVARHEGTKLVDLPAPVQPAIAAPVPNFTPIGPKQGSVALVSVAPGQNRMYFTQRVPVDGITPNEGPYVVWCMSF